MNSMVGTRGRPRLSRRSALALASVAGLVTATLSIGGKASATAIDPQTLSAELAATATSLQSVVASAQPENAAGVSIDVPSGTVYVYLTGAATSALTSAISAADPAQKVVVRTVKFTEAQLEAAQAAIAAQMPSLIAAGAQITEYGPDQKNNSLHVAMIQPTSAAEVAVTGAAGAVPVQFETASAAPRLVSTRLKDTAPFNGGDFIDDGSQGCTAGPPVWNPSNGHAYILSVGHCAEGVTGTRFYNDDALDSNKCGYTGTGCAYIGTSAHVDDSSTGTWDDALIGGTTYSNLDWQNNTPYNPPGTLNGYYNPQTTYSTSVQGELVCPSGAYEGMVCGTGVWFVKQNIVIAGRTYSNIDRAANTTTQPTGEGDSGGPVFTTPSGHLNVEGVIEAGGAQQACQKYAVRGNYCSDTIYYFDFQTQMNHFGLGLTLKATY